jgi:hypothetical protein
VRVVHVDLPWPLLVRLGNRGAAHGAADPHVIEPLEDRAEAGLDVTQALAIRELREGHGKELIRQLNRRTRRFPRSVQCSGRGQTEIRAPSVARKPSLRPSPAAPSFGVSGTMGSTRDEFKSMRLWKTRNHLS